MNDESQKIKVSSYRDGNVIAHHGVKSQEWGKRRYQYEDGSLTPLGRIHYGVGKKREESKIKMREEKAASKAEARVIKAQSKAEARIIRERNKAERKLAKLQEDTVREQNREAADVSREQIQAENKQMDFSKALAITALIGGVGYGIYKFKTGKSSEAAEKAIKEASKANASEYAKKGKDIIDATWRDAGAPKFSGEVVGNAASKASRLIGGPVKSKGPSVVDGVWREVGKDLPAVLRRSGLKRLVKHGVNNMEGMVLIATVKDNGYTIQHHGVKGQKWGVRRWQYEDGSLTPDGRIHYGRQSERSKAKAEIHGQKAEGWKRGIGKSAAASAGATAAVNTATTLQTAIGISKAAGVPLSQLTGWGVAFKSIAATAGVAGAGGALAAVAGWGIHKLIKKHNEKKAAEAEKILEENKNKPASEIIKKQQSKEESEDSQENRKGPFKYETVAEFAKKDPEGYRKSIYGEVERREKIKSAKDNDKFDLTFLEATQNDVRNENKSWMIKEYEKYLKDPETYFRSFNPKLG